MKLLPTINLYCAGILIVFISFASCDSNQTQDVVNKDDTVTLTSRFEDVEKIFYSVPSPVETVQLLQQAGATYNANYVNDVMKVSSYTSNQKMAINLGVYGADLSYNSIFDRTQENMFTFEACDKLAKALSLSEAFDKTIFTRVEDNYESRDTMINLISEAYWTADDYLRENDRSDIAALIITGGWVEGLYIATQMAKNDSNNREIINRVAEQKYSLQSLSQLIKSYHSDSALDEIGSDLVEINAVFDKISITNEKGENTFDKVTGITTIGGTTTIDISKNILEELINKVATIRMKYVN